MILEVSFLISKTHPEPSRTQQNPLTGDSPNGTRGVSGRLNALSALKHKMFSYSYNGNPETHGSMSYVFFIDQIPKSLTFERAETRTRRNKATLNLPSHPQQGQNALLRHSSQALLLLSFSFLHMHTSCRAFPVWGQ